MADPSPSSSLGLPPSQGHTVRASIINGSTGHLPVAMLLGPLKGPSIAGHENVRMSNYSFLVESDNKKQKVLFDLGIMKDADNNMPPACNQPLNAR